jgi:hypothetical protein
MEIYHSFDPLSIVTTSKPHPNCRSGNRGEIRGASHGIEIIILGLLQLRGATTTNI